MADKDFVLAVPPGRGVKHKRLVPPHYLEPPFNFKLAPTQVQEPAPEAGTTTVTEPAKPGNKKEASE